MYRTGFSGLQQFLALFGSEVPAQFDGVCEDGQSGRIPLYGDFSGDPGQGNTVIGGVDP